MRTMKAYGNGDFAPLILVLGTRGRYVNYKFYASIPSELGEGGGGWAP